MTIEINHERVPRHVAIIMDGNGRWAESRNLSRTQGHVEGVKRVEEIVAAAQNMGIKVLTLFTFSTENWSRPKKEVSMLMDLLSNVLERKVQKLKRNNVRIQIIGKKDGIPEFLLRRFNAVVEETKNNSGIIMNLAFNYGARLELVDAVRSIAQAVQEGRLGINDINEESISRSLYTKDLPDPDLLIRTSGEQRISNFLLWQLSYAEFYFTEVLWPDFNEDELKKAIEEYQHRERRFGNLSAK